jgi:hypothetical protein
MRSHGVAAIFEFESSSAADGGNQMDGTGKLFVSAAVLQVRVQISANQTATLLFQA